MGGVLERKSTIASGLQAASDVTEENVCSKNGSCQMQGLKIGLM